MNFIFFIGLILPALASFFFQCHLKNLNGDKKKYGRKTDGKTTLTGSIITDVDSGYRKMTMFGRHFIAKKRAHYVSYVTFCEKHVLLNMY